MKAIQHERTTNSAAVLQPIHLLNLQFLVTLRDALRADPVQASYDYDIDVATADLIRKATDEGLRTLSFSLNRAVFTLRVRGGELCEVLTKQEPLRALMAAARDAAPIK